MSSSSYLVELLNNNAIDICGISEHWLYEKNLYFLESLDNNYKSYAVSDFDLKRPSSRKVGKGGVAILWHDKINKCVTPIELDDDRIVGIQVMLDTDNFMYFFQVYLPCSNHSIYKYREYIEKLENINSIYSQKGVVCFMGDMNCDIYKESHIPMTSRMNVLF